MLCGSVLIIMVGSGGNDEGVNGSRKEIFPKSVRWVPCDW